MAISPIHPMLLLLASVFFLPSLHAVGFDYCNREGYVYGNITRVDISPNPVDVDGTSDPTITLFGFANKTSSTIYRGKLVVSVDYLTPWRTRNNRTLVTKIVDENDGIIEHGKNFKLSVRVPMSEANGGAIPVRVTLIDVHPIYDEKPVPQERLCFSMYFPTKYPPIRTSS